MALPLLFLLAPLALPLQVRRIDLAREPWSAVMSAVQTAGDAAARAELERIGRTDTSLPAWQRSHAWRWAGQLAVRNDLLAAAREDFNRAAALNPDGFDGHMARVHLGEVAIREQRWYEAARALEPEEHDADPIVATYAQDRLRTVRERTRRLTWRYASLGVLAAGALLFLARLVVVLRHRARFPRLGEFGTALFVGEAVALAGAFVVPRILSMLARPGWMAFAIPAALVSAVLWSTRTPGAPRRRQAFVVLATLVAFAAGYYLAIDYTWLSAERPIQ